MRAEKHEMGSGMAYNQPCSQFPSAISAAPGMSIFTPGWEFLCCQKAGVEVFQGHQIQGEPSSPLHPWPWPEVFLSSLETLGFVMLAGEDGSSAYWDKRKKHMAKPDPPWLESHCLCRTPCQNPGKHKLCQGRCFFPTMSFLLQKEHALCFILCLEKGKTKQVLLKEVHYNPNLHFTLKFKKNKGQVCLRVSCCYLNQQDLCPYKLVLVWQSGQSAGMKKTVLPSVFSGIKYSSFQWEKSLSLLPHEERHHTVFRTIYHLKVT